MCRTTGRGPDDAAWTGTVRDVAREWACECGCGHCGLRVVVGDDAMDCCPDVGRGGTGDPERGVGGAVGMGVFVGSAMVLSPPNSWGVLG